MSASTAFTLLHQPDETPNPGEVFQHKWLKTIVIAGDCNPKSQNLLRKKNLDIKYPKNDSYNFRDL